MRGKLSCSLYVGRSTEYKFPLPSLLTSVCPAAAIATAPASPNNHQRALVQCWLRCAALRRLRCCQIKVVVLCV